MGIFVHLPLGASDGHGAFTTSLRLDASFAIPPHVLLLNLLDRCHDLVNMVTHVLLRLSMSPGVRNRG